MASVFRAVLDGPMGFRKEVALKQIRAESAGDNPVFAQALINEARLGGHLRHPNVVETYELQEAAGTFFIAMEYVQGLTLRTIQRGCAARGVLAPLPVVLEIADQLCAGLEYAHAAVDEHGARLNLVHRDLKPANIIVSRGGTTKIMDFGIAKTPANLYQTAETGSAKGTPYYMSPEQIRGADDLDHRSDLFALGTVLFELACGTRLFPEKDFGELYMALVQGAATGRLEPLDARLDGLAEVVGRCLALDRDGGDTEGKDRVRPGRASLRHSTVFQGDPPGRVTETAGPRRPWPPPRKTSVPPPWPLRVLRGEDHEQSPTASPTRPTTATH
ncbi:MAG: serine/threonine protein kinase [Proteobacteria bacterium]|nr:serine/threonine protein kinase [Pseudomonadota bacterium]